MGKLRVSREQELEGDGGKPEPKLKSNANSSDSSSEPTDNESRDESQDEEHDTARPTLAAQISVLPQRFSAMEERLGGIESIMLDLRKQVKAQDVALKGVATGQTLITDSVTETVSPPVLSSPRHLVCR
jgi:hypothetical protein